MKKIIYFTLILLLILISSTTQVYATSKHTIGEIVQEGDSFIKTGEASNTPIKEENLKNMSNTIYNILFITGIIIAFVVGGILGIKFLIEGIEGKAEVKTMLVPYIIGIVVLFGAFTIWKIVLTILQA